MRSRSVDTSYWHVHL